MASYGTSFVDDWFRLSNVNEMGGHTYRHTGRLSHKLTFIFAKPRTWAKNGSLRYGI
jgi:hypothetical protein